jgi:N-acetylglucosaminyldiphosphoundecaprenol N-acetyl-beta-D-mannosaminyltransferase
MSQQLATESALTLFRSRAGTLRRRMPTGLPTEGAVARADIHDALRTIPRRLVSVLGVAISDFTRPDALHLLETLASADDGRSRAVFIVNTHTLNVSADQPDYRDVLNSADFVLNDGTGVRWAARQRGIELRTNLVGTDLIPEFFQATAGRGYSYFLLGADPDTIKQAAAVARDRYVGWTQAGYHHGFIHNGLADEVINRINATRANILLVGMGNPLQERWIRTHQPRLRVPLAMGVGGLFDHWIDKPRRAPLWVRRMGCEWVHKLMLQPHKWRRYLLGNPKFLFRIAHHKQQDLAAMQACKGAELVPAEVRPTSSFTKQQI